MAYTGQRKTVTATMYRAEVVEARQEINSLQSFDTPELIEYAGTWLSLFAAGSAAATVIAGGLAAAGVAAVWGLTNLVSNNYLEEQEDMYTEVLEDMLKDTPVIYIKVKQKYKYIKNGKGEGWVIDGNPTISRYYSDGN